MDKVRLNDIGVAIILTITDQDGTVVDISGAIVKQIILKSQSGDLKTKTAQLHTDGSDGKARYTTVDGDLDSIGDWQAEANVQLSDGTWRSTRYDFRVEDVLS